MEREVFTDKKIISYLKKNFIPIKVDTDKESKLSGKFGIRGLPDSWFLNESGERISHLPGFLSSRILLSALQFIQTESYKKTSFYKFSKEGKKK